MVDNGLDIFWAAFGGGAAAGIFTLIALSFAEWLRWFVGRPLLKVSMAFAYARNVPMFQENIPYICLTASNPHSKSVVISSFGFDYKSRPKQKFQIMSDGTCSFPYEVRGGQSISQMSRQENLFDALLKEEKKPSDLKGVWFQSESGKVFRGKISSISMHALEEAFKIYRGRFNKNEGGKKPQLQLGYDQRKNYVLLQGLSCFLAFCFFVEGFTFLTERNELVSYLSVIFSFPFLVFAFILFASTIFKDIPLRAERIIENPLLQSSLDILSFAGLLVTWLLVVDRLFLLQNLGYNQSLLGVLRWCGYIFIGFFWIVFMYSHSHGLFYLFKRIFYRLKNRHS